MTKRRKKICQNNRSKKVVRSEEEGEEEEKTSSLPQTLEKHFWRLMLTPFRTNRQQQMAYI